MRTFGQSQLRLHDLSFFDIRRQLVFRQVAGDVGLAVTNGKLFVCAIQCIEKDSLSPFFDGMLERIRS
jgi:hypothetical protein